MTAAEKKVSLIYHPFTSTDNERRLYITAKI